MDGENWQKYLENTTSDYVQPLAAVGLRINSCLPWPEVALQEMA